ncbi:unnamed protein product [Pleuronectes platessa]|uniref:Uncharacterized protein n=1 Tax=Pleuronectes platessa TaxID=8262 RepID=A0A9N7VL35_PLEPL|nr:unnamed protein product [Pleuronectes platessa]
MDPRDGHRECPTCLGMAHLMDDIENPCVAAVELPVEERVKRARWVEQSVRAGAVQPLPAKLNERGHTSRKAPRKRRHEHTPVRRRDSGKTQAPKPSQNPAGQHDDTQLQILAAIRGLSERLVELRPSTRPQQLGHRGMGSPPRTGYPPIRRRMWFTLTFSLSMLKIPFLKVMGSLRVLLG